MPEKVARKIIGATFEFDPVSPLESYTGPRLTVSTPQDGPVQELHELVPGVDHETVEGTSHWIQLDDPDGFDAILDAFLERVDKVDQTKSRSPVGAARFSNLKPPARCLRAGGNSDGNYSSMRSIRRIARTRSRAVVPMAHAIGVTKPTSWHAGQPDGPGAGSTSAGTRHDR